MTTLNYTSTAGDPALDAAFEQALAKARTGRPDPLAHLIGNRWVADGEQFERADPCDPARIVSRAHRASSEVVAAAVAAARAAQPGWAAMPLAERAAALRRIAKLIGERAVEMGAVVSAETGKVRLESVPEVVEGVDLIEAYCGHMERNDGYVYRARAARARGAEHPIPDRTCGGLDGATIAIVAPSRSAGGLILTAAT